MLHAKSTRFDTRLDRLDRMAQAEPNVVRVQQVNGVLVRFEEPPSMVGPADREAGPSAQFIEAGLRHVSMLGLDGQQEAVVIRPKWPRREEDCSGAPLALEVEVVSRSAILPERPEPVVLPVPPRSQDRQDEPRTEGADKWLNGLTALVGLGGLAALAAAVGLGDQSAGLGLLCGTAALVVATAVLVGVELWRAALEMTHGAYGRAC